MASLQVFSPHQTTSPFREITERSQGVWRSKHLFPLTIQRKETKELMQSPSSLQLFLFPERTSRTDWRVQNTLIFACSHPWMSPINYSSTSRRFGTGVTRCHRCVQPAASRNISEGSAVAHPTVNIPEDESVVHYLYWNYSSNQAP